MLAMTIMIVTNYKCYFFCSKENWFGGMDRDVVVRQARVLVDRLGRCSADSVWAHKASGVRAALDKGLGQVARGEADMGQLEALVEIGYQLVEKAAGEIPDF